MGLGIQIGVGNMGGVVASNIYRTQDAPRYLLGRRSTVCTTDELTGFPILDGLVIMFLVVGLLMVPSTVLVYKRINARRDLAESLNDVREKDGQNGDTAALGDQRASFRYTI